MIRVEAKGSARKRIKGLIGALAIVGGMAAFAGPATAHVHGITPLRCVGVENDGANQVDNTPASTANGGPIPTDALIPRDVGRSPLDVGDGGFDTPACPAT
jgi:hypothetical protein